MRIIVTTASALALFASPVAGQNCNILEMGQQCAKHSIKKTDDIDKLCLDPCVDAMMHCTDSPEFGQMVGKNVRVQMANLKSMCKSGTGKAGDGVCNAVDIPKYENQLKGRDPQCGDDLMKEMFDCIDNPMFAKQRTHILDLRAGCQDGGAGSAGDGKCDLLAISQYAKEEKDAATPTCNSNMIKEAFDCMDNPLLATQRKMLLDLRALCQSKDGADCYKRISALEPAMHKGGACCPAGDPCEKEHHDGKDSPPETCSAACAKIWVPFWQQCSAVLTPVMKDTPKEKGQSVSALANMQKFDQTCKTSSGH